MAENTPIINTRRVIETLMVAAILAIAGWAWRAEVRMSKVEDQGELNSKFWKLHHQVQDAINEERAAAGKPLFKWDLD